MQRVAPVASSLLFVEPTAPVGALFHTLHVCRFAVTRTERQYRVVRGLPELHDNLVFLNSACDPLPAWLGAHISAPGINCRHAFGS